MIAIIHESLKTKTFWTRPLNIQSYGAVCRNNYRALSSTLVVEIWCRMKQCPSHKTWQADSLSLRLHRLGRVSLLIAFHFPLYFSTALYSSIVKGLMIQHPCCMYDRSSITASARRPFNIRRTSGSRSFVLQWSGRMDRCIGGLAPVSNFRQL